MFSRRRGFGGPPKPPRPRGHRGYSVGVTRHVLIVGCLGAALATAILGSASVAAPSPGPAAPAPAPQSDLTKFQPRYPKTPQQTRYVVEVNAKGQVSGVRSGTRSTDPRFDAVTHGNVVQTFIRRSDGKAISGLYRVSYDYDPKTQLVKRTVALLHAGGVNATAPGLVDVYAEASQRAALKAQAAQKSSLQQQLKDQLKNLHPTAAPSATPH